jgi:hypothetical protein
MVPLAHPALTLLTAVLASVLGGVLGWYVRRRPLPGLLLAMLITAQIQVPPGEYLLRSQLSGLSIIVIREPLASGSAAQGANHPMKAD